MSGKAAKKTLVHPRTTVHKTFSRFVQAGALVVVSYGPLANKVAIISDIIDQNKIIIDGPTSDVQRQVINVKWVALTDFLLPISRGAGTTAIKAALAKDDLVAKWKASSWGKTLVAREAKANLTDFERFQARYHLKTVQHAVRKQYNIARRAAKGLPPKAPRKKVAKKTATK